MVDSLLSLPENLIFSRFTPIACNEIVVRL